MENMAIREEYRLLPRYSYSFNPMSIKRYEDIDYHGRIQAVTFLAIGQIKKKCGILIF